MTTYAFVGIVVVHKSSFDRGDIQRFHLKRSVLIAEHMHDYKHDIDMQVSVMTTAT